jgi:RimJ/RimL family protein N-acetyltransferase
MLFDLQPTLENELVRLRPLKEDEFEPLFAVASDPLIWEQHPNKYRYQREDFLKYFEGAVASKGALLIFNNKTGVLIGSSRYYELDETKSSVAIGYTFIARDFWGTTYNRAIKTLMLNHAFGFVNEVIFHVGANNTRSQKAMEKLGAIKIDEIEVAYYGEPGKLNFVYRVDRALWKKICVPEE